MAVAGDAFAALVAEAEHDRQVLAVILYGSRAKGRATVHSDFDFAIIVTPAAASAWIARIASLDHAILDGQVFSLAAFEAWADWNGPQRWVRYAMDGAKLMFDRTGDIQAVIDAKARAPLAQTASFIDASLDHFINQVYRCAKCHRDGDALAARLEAVEAIAPLLDVIFALDHGRLRPYAKHLAWELETRPPPALPLPPTVFLARLKRLLDGDDLAVLRQWLGALDPIARAAGHAAVLDRWGDGLDWMLEADLGQD